MTLTESDQIKENKKYMEAALDIAFQRLGLTSPNPAVGAVIVKNNKVVSSGGTEKYGGRHAEIVAIENADDTKDSEIYVSLEPCCHHGKTPPCTDAIIKAGISKVIIPILDPNPMVAGKGVAALRNAGVDVIILREMQNCAIDLYRPFKKNILRKLPFVLNKSAITLDGRIASKTGDSQWISSAYSRYLVHKLRAKVDAILVGKNTFISDNPSLTVRIESFQQDIYEYFDTREFSINGRENYFIEALLKKKVSHYKQPCRIVLGLPENIPIDNKLMVTDNYIIYESKKNIDKIYKESRIKNNILDSMNIVTLKGNDSQENIIHMLEDISNRGISFLMLEGGGSLNGSFYDIGEIDQFFYTICPKVIGNGIPVINAQGKDTIQESMSVHDITVVPINEDILYNGYKEVYHFEMM